MEGINPIWGTITVFCLIFIARELLKWVLGTSKLDKISEQLDKIISIIGKKEQQDEKNISDNIGDR